MVTIIGNKQNPVSGASDGTHRYTLNANFNEVQWAQAIPGSQLTKAFWPVRLGAVMAVASTTDTNVTLAVWKGSAPTTLAGKTAAFQIFEFNGALGSPMGSQTVDLTSTAVLAANTAVSVGVAIPDNANPIFMQRHNSYPNRAWRREVVGPTNPFGTPTTTSPTGGPANESGYAVWMEGQWNTAPNPPTGVKLNGVAIPATEAGLDTTDTTPTITGLFTDVDEILYRDDAKTQVVIPLGSADKMNQFQITIRNRTTNAIVQTTLQNATPAMQAARQFEWTPAALTPGQYRLDSWFSDQSGTWSSGFSILYFTVVAATVTVAGPPSGKITDTTPDTFGFTYNVASGSTASDAVEILIIKSGYTIRSSPTILKATAANASNTITWAQTGFAALTEYTGDHQYKVRARYGGVWTEWSPAADFSINSPPNIPTNLTPNGSVTGTYPNLQAIITDPDDASSTLSPAWEITPPTGSPFTLTAYNSYLGSNKWQSLTGSGSHTAGFGTYKFRVRATDGSGAIGLWSGFATWTYAAVPAVVITSVAPLTSSFPVIYWTTEGTATPTATQQAKRRVSVYRDGESTPVWETPLTAIQTTSRTVGVALSQGNYTAKVTVENSSGIQGESSGYSFTIAFIPPAALDSVSTQPQALPNDLPNQPTGVLVEYSQSLLDPTAFGGYVIDRLDNSGLWVTVGEVNNQLQTSFIDPIPPGNIDLIYAVRQIELVTGGSVLSDRVGAWANVPIESLVLTDVFTGETVTLRLIQPDDYRPQLITDVVELNTRTTSPTEIRGVQEYERVSIRARIAPGAYSDAIAVFDTMKALARKRTVGTAKVPRIVCKREGGTSERLFGSIVDFSWQPRYRRGDVIVEFAWVQRNFTEGLVAE